MCVCLLLSLLLLSCWLSSVVAPNPTLHSTHMVGCCFACLVVSVRQSVYNIFLPLQLALARAYGAAAGRVQVPETHDLGQHRLVARAKRSPVQRERVRARVRTIRGCGCNSVVPPSRTIIHGGNSPPSPTPPSTFGRLAGAPPNRAPSAPHSCLPACACHKRHPPSPSPSSTQLHKPTRPLHTGVAHAACIAPTPPPLNLTHDRTARAFLRPVYIALPLLAAFITAQTDFSPPT